MDDDEMMIFWYNRLTFGWLNHRHGNEKSGDTDSSDTHEKQSDGSISSVV
jgi:hypothetical protein